MLYNDIWYLATPAVDGFLTASTCNGGALWDTTIAIYDYDPGETSLNLLADYLVSCNEDCGDGAFASEVQVEATAGATYLVRVGGLSLIHI